MSMFAQMVVDLSQNSYVGPSMVQSKRLLDLLFIEFPGVRHSVIVIEQNDLEEFCRQLIVIELLESFIFASMDENQNKALLV